MYAFYVMLVGTKEKKSMAGEWMEKILSFLQTHCKGMEMDIIVSVIKECMRHVYPNVPIFSIGRRVQGVFGKWCKCS